MIIVAALLADTGSVLERYRYNAYGERDVQTSAFASRSDTNYTWEYSFTTRRLDLETGCMYYRNRYYHPTLGRFQKRDPIGYEGGTHLFAFTNATPIFVLDPSGLLSLEYTIDVPIEIPRIPFTLAWVEFKLDITWHLKLSSPETPETCPERLIGEPDPISPFVERSPYGFFGVDLSFGARGSNFSVVAGWTFGAKTHGHNTLSQIWNMTIEVGHYAEGDANIQRFYEEASIPPLGDFKCLCVTWDLSVSLDSDWGVYNMRALAAAVVTAAGVVAVLEPTLVGEMLLGSAAASLLLSPPLQP